MGCARSLITFVLLGAKEESALAYVLTVILFAKRISKGLQKKMAGVLRRSIINRVSFQRI